MEYVPTALNVPAVWKLLAQQSESFGGPNKGFAQHRTEGTRPGPTKCGWNDLGKPEPEPPTGSLIAAQAASKRKQSWFVLLVFWGYNRSE
jgi:hypothetical protein